MAEYEHSKFPYGWQAPAPELSYNKGFADGFKKAIEVLINYERTYHEQGSTNNGYPSGGAGR
jgi:hypothetical protein